MLGELESARVSGAGVIPEAEAPEQVGARGVGELAVVEYIGWYNSARLHESLGDIPPLEYELHALDDHVRLEELQV